MSNKKSVSFSSKSMLYTDRNSVLIRTKTYDGVKNDKFNDTIKKFFVTDPIRKVKRSSIRQIPSTNVHIPRMTSLIGWLAKAEPDRQWMTFPRTTKLFVTQEEMIFVKDLVDGLV